MNHAQNILILKKEQGVYDYVCVIPIFLNRCQGFYYFLIFLKDCLLIYSNGHSFLQYYYYIPMAPPGYFADTA